MQISSNSNIKEAELRASNIVSCEKNLVSLYTSFLSAEREGTMKLQLYNLLSDQKEILDEIQYELPTNEHK
ncbi:hypothetical protein G9F72_024865 [Clostridium estertheticum]|uniref:hypothetical protein n=1 Tax=Clostridium estertheticum TaxID=238834 RepID=UPI0013E974A4|nr:hypothetical protein [Clostridium estertheticum]MBZ9689521.1 hypothetical protein [Clostridium estertheticum]